jgi:hypothetical protein
MSYQLDITPHSQISPDSSKAKYAMWLATTGSARVN